MAHFAELDDSNIVVRVIVVSNDDCLDQNGVESEAVGVGFCENLLGGTWVQTSYNSKFRKNYASPGHTYDVQRNAFIPSKPPGDNWVLDEETCLWFDPEVAKVNATIGVSRV